MRGLAVISRVVKAPGAKHFVHAIDRVRRILRYQRSISGPQAGALRPCRLGFLGMVVNDDRVALLILVSMPVLMLSADFRFVRHRCSPN